MSTKQYRILKSWYDALGECVKERGEYVSAGRVAAKMGESRNTAKKYLSILEHGRSVISQKVILINGIEAKLYAPIEGDN